MPVAVPAPSPPRPSLPRACKKPVVYASPGRARRAAPMKQKNSISAGGAKAFVAALTTRKLVVRNPDSHPSRLPPVDEHGVNSIVRSLEQLHLDLPLFADRSALAIITYLILMNYGEEQACADELARNGIKVYDYEYTPAANRLRLRTAKRVRARIAAAEERRRQIAEEDLWRRQYIDEQSKIRQGLLKPKQATIKKPPPLKGKPKPLRRDETIVSIPLSATIGHTPISPPEWSNKLHAEMSMYERSFALKSCLRTAMWNAAQRRWKRMIGPSRDAYSPPIEPEEFGRMFSMLLGALLLEFLWTAYQNLGEDELTDEDSEAGTETE